MGGQLGKHAAVAVSHEILPDGARRVGQARQRQLTAVLPCFFAASFRAFIRDDLPLFGSPTTIIMLNSEAARSLFNQFNAEAMTCSQHTILVCD